MSYYNDIANIAVNVKAVANEIEQLEKHRNDWVRPQGQTFYLSGHIYVTRKDGTTPALLEGVKREAIKAFDAQILAKKSELEGLRFQLVQLGKKGGTA